MSTYWYALQKYFIFLFQWSKSTDSFTHPTAQMSTRNAVAREFLIAAFTQLAINSAFWKRLENVQFPACIKLLKSAGECWEIKKTVSLKKCKASGVKPQNWPALPDTPSLLWVALGQDCVTPKQAPEATPFSPMRTSFNQENLDHWQVKLH